MTFEGVDVYKRQVRIVFDLAGEPAWWWSMLVLAFAGVTTVMGVLYALCLLYTSRCV